jgi:PadR family transcriptional regulator PadR
MDRHSQLIKGVLDMCLLGLIAEGPTYGYEMIRTFQDRGFPVMSEGSIYPRLAYLEKQGWATSSKRPSPDGPVRKYYELTDAGRRQGEVSVGEWNRFDDAVEQMTKEFT